MLSVCLTGINFLELKENTSSKLGEMVLLEIVSKLASLELGGMD